VRVFRTVLQNSPVREISTPGSAQGTVGQPALFANMRSEKQLAFGCQVSRNRLAQKKPNVSVLSQSTTSYRTRPAVRLSFFQRRPVIGPELEPLADHFRYKHYRRLGYPTNRNVPQPVRVPPHAGPRPRRLQFFRFGPNKPTVCTCDGKGFSGTPSPLAFRP